MSRPVGRVQDKVVLVTGAARGQGRNHARRLAEEGADVVLVDVCADIPPTPYPLATRADLDDAVEQVERAGRQALAVTADVRDPAALAEATAAAVERFGRLDVVVAQAAISALGAHQDTAAWVRSVDVNLIGVINTVHAAFPHLRAGASIIAVGSIVGLRPRRAYDAAGPGSAGYKYAKLAVSHYIHELATVLAPDMIRANAVIPTNVDTPMLHNDVTYQLFRPDLEAPTRDDAEPAFPSVHAMPVPYATPDEISHAVLYLASDESRLVTGLQLRVDAGGYVKANPFRP